MNRCSAKRQHILCLEYVSASDQWSKPRAFRPIESQICSIFHTIGLDIDTTDDTETCIYAYDRHMKVQDRVITSDLNTSCTYQRTPTLEKYKNMVPNPLLYCLAYQNLVLITSVSLHRMRMECSHIMNECYMNRKSLDTWFSYTTSASAQNFHTWKTYIFKQTSLQIKQLTST